MIELPAGMAPNDVEFTRLDFGIIQRPVTGAGATRFDRPGTRFAATFTFPPLRPEDAGVVHSRLLRAVSEGLRLPVPLLGVSQGYPGAPVVDGAGQAGTTLALRGLTPHWFAKEGYWLTIIDAAGKRFLHRAAGPVAADAAGEMALPIWPPLRAPFADGATVLLARPEMEGLVTSEVPLRLPRNRRVVFEVSIEETD